MLKRISFTSSDPPQHLPLPRTPTLPLHSPSTSPGYNGTYFPPSDSSPLSPDNLPTVERPTLHKTLASLSELLGALDEYRGALTGKSKAEKKVARLARELGGLYGDKVEGGARSEVILQALGAGAGMFEVLGVVDLGHAKAVQKEYESVNEVVGKWFKKVAKEEKAFDESMASMDGKVQKATTAYEKSRPRPSNTRSLSTDQSAALSHDKYITALSSLSASIGATKKSHAESMGEKRERAGKEVGRVLCGLADREWKNRIEGTKMGGVKAGEVAQRGVWCEVGMPAEVPSDTPDTPMEQKYTRGPRTLVASTDGYSTASFPSSQSTLFNASPKLPSETFLAPLHPNDAPSSQRSSPNHSTPTSPLVPPPRLFNSPPTPRENTNGRPVVDRQSSADSITSYRSSVPKHPEAQSRVTPTTRGYDRPTSPLHIDRRPVDDPLIGTSRTRQAEELRLEDETEEVTSIMSSWHSGLSEQVRRPTPRHSPPQPQAPVFAVREERLERMESSASERSFVAMMKEKYRGEKEDQSRKEWDREREEGRRVLPTVPILPRSNSRVSTLAQRYSISSSLDPPSPAPQSTHSSTPRPLHRHSYSAAPPSSSSGFNEFGQQRPDSRPPPSRSYSHAPTTSYTSQRSSDPRPRSPNFRHPPETHPDFCGCQKCSVDKYRESEGTTREEEERRQREVRRDGRGGEGRRIFGGR